MIAVIVVSDSDSMHEATYETKRLKRAQTGTAGKKGGEEGDSDDERKKR